MTCAAAAAQVLGAALGAGALLPAPLPLPALVERALEGDPDVLEEPLPPSVEVPLDEPEGFCVDGVAAEDLPRLSVR